MTTHITKTWFDGEKVVTQEIPESEVYKQEPRFKEWTDDYVRYNIHKLKAQPSPVQEPVAWQYRDAKDDGTWSAWLGCDKRLTESAWREVRPLYTTPPAAQRQWVGLTDDDLVACSDSQKATVLYFLKKLKEKNNG